MSDNDDNDRDDESYARPSRDRGRSPHDDDDSHRSSHHGNPKLSSKEKASIGKKAAEKSGGLFSPEDWMCKSCGNINWARRTTCNMCNMPKYQKTEARTGAGGGYNERDNVEYNQKREESDGEYDEFGRKKKKFRNVTKSSDEASNDGIPRASKTKTRPLAEDEEDDEEDDDEFDATKYALDSEDEDNEGEEKNHRRASSSTSNKKSSSSGERHNSRSSSSSADDRSENRKSDQASSSNSHRRSNSPRNSKRKDDYQERRRSRSRSPISPTNRTHQKSSRH